MKVLWITNTIFPDVCQELGLPSPVFGGWMYSAAEALMRSSGNIELGVASLYSGKVLKCLVINEVNYFLIPRSQSYHQYDQKLESYWKKVEDQFQPDVVHIHGTEFPHGLAYVEACGNGNVVVSIQGLVSVIERYYYGGISEKDLQRNVTLRDWIRHDSILEQRSKMQRRGEYEIQLIKKVHHVIGRTSWDKAHIWAINDQAIYHTCNETLRNEFYAHSWQKDKCEKHQIFLSQSHYPLKGVQQMIKALPMILRHYPDTKVYVAGNNFMTSKKWWRINGFENYIRSLAKKLGVEDKILFTGVMTEKEMCDKYLKSNVFVCPSSIENSPNSVSEAQMLGVPCVASFVGGIPDLINHDDTGLLYRFEESEMLAEAVCRILEDVNLANRLSQNGRQAAKKRHDQQKNATDLYNIYQKISTNSNVIQKVS